MFYDLSAATAMEKLAVSYLDPNLKVFQFGLISQLIFTECHIHSRRCMLCKEKSLLRGAPDKAAPLLHLWVG